MAADMERMHAHGFVVAERDVRDARVAVLPGKRRPRRWKQTSHVIGKCQERQELTRTRLYCWKP